MYWTIAIFVQLFLFLFFFFFVQLFLSNNKPKEGLGSPQYGTLDLTKAIAKDMANSYHSDRWLQSWQVRVMAVEGKHGVGGGNSQDTVFSGLLLLLLLSRFSRVLVTTKWLVYQYNPHSVYLAQAFLKNFLWFLRIHQIKSCMSFLRLP